VSIISGATENGLKVIPVFNEALQLGEIRGSGCMDPCILHRGDEWSTSCTSLFTSHRYSLGTRLGVTQSRFGPLLLLKNQTDWPDRVVSVC